MRVMILAAAMLVGCGGDTTVSNVTPFEVNEDPSLIVEGSKYYGQSWSERSKNFQKDNDDGYLEATAHVGKKANDAREYAYERGPKDARHGSEAKQGAAGTNGAAGEVGATGDQGQQGSQGAAGQSGSNGSDGSQGEDGVAGPAGQQGEQGIAGDDFNGDDRLTDLEDRVETLETIVSAQGSLITALQSADADLQSDINQLGNELDQLKRKVKKLKKKQRRDVRRLMGYIIDVANSQQPSYDIEVNYTYTNVEIDNRLIQTIRDNILQIVNCGDGWQYDCEVELDD